MQQRRPDDVRVVPARHRHGGHRDGRDTTYRLHGTVEPTAIGATVSSGRIRLFDRDFVDIYRRVPAGTRVVVRPAGETVVSETDDGSAFRQEAHLRRPGQAAWTIMV